MLEVQAKALFVLVHLILGSAQLILLLFWSHASLLVDGGKTKKPWILEVQTEVLFVLGRPILGSAQRILSSRLRPLKLDRVKAGHCPP